MVALSISAPLPYSLLVKLYGSGWGSIMIVGFLALSCVSVKRTPGITERTVKAHLANIYM